MSLMTQIKKDRMLANKRGDIAKYQALTTLVSEIQRLEKPDQENDEKVQKVIAKSVKDLTEMIQVMGIECIGLQSKIDDKLRMIAEKNILKAYLPKQMSEDEMKNAISEIISEIGAESVRDMGKVMKSLKEKFNGQYDGKAASALVREILNG